MKRNYIKLLLTSSLVLTNIEIDACANPEADIFENVSKGPVRSRLSTEILSSRAIEIPQENLFLPSAVGKVSISYYNNEFYVTKNNHMVQVQRHDLSKELRGISEEGLKGFLSSGYLAVKKMDDDYGIDAKFRLRGGDPATDAVTRIGSAIVNVLIPGGVEVIKIVYRWFTSTSLPPLPPIP